MFGGNSKKETKAPEEVPNKAKVLNVAASENFVVLSSEKVMVEIGKGGWAKFDGFRASVGVSFKDIPAQALIQKFTKKEWPTAKIEKELAKRRTELCETYKREILDKLENLNIDPEVIDAVSKALSKDILLGLLK